MLVWCRRGSNIQGSGVALAGMSALFFASSGVDFLAAQNAFSSSDELKLDENCPS